jgi:hypothetical protein
MCRELTILIVCVQHTPPSLIFATHFTHILYCHICFSMYSIKLMQFGDVSYNGELTTECFADGGLKQAQLMDDCVNCLAYDDQVHRPNCYGYRIFLGPRISVCHSHSQSLDRNLLFYTCLHQSMSLMQMLLHPKGHDLGASCGESTWTTM